MTRVLAVRDLRLAIPALVLWAACGVAVGLPEVRPVAIALAALAAAVGILAVAAGMRGRRRLAGVLAVAAVGAALATAGCVAIAASDGARRPPPLDAAATGQRSVTLDIRTEADPIAGRIRGTAEAVTTTSGQWRTRSPVLLFSVTPVRMPVGSLLRVTAAVRAAGPGDDVAYLAFARDPPRRIGRPAPLLEGLAGIRAGFSETARELPSPGGGLLPGLAIGDTAAVPEQLTADMRTASLTHLTAVSGANCAVIVALTLAVLSALGAPRSVRIVGAVAMLGLFVALVLPQPSVLRAAAMALLVLVATALGRPVRGLPLLSAAVATLLVVDPWLSRDFGFVLSVLATGGLLVIAPVLAARLGRIMPRPLALAIAVPTAAQLAVQPVLVLLNPVVPLWGIPANLLAEPAAPVATVLGLAACAILPVLPPVGHLLAWLAWVPSAWIAGVARVSAGLPGASLPWLPGFVGFAGMTGLTALVIVAILARGGRPRAIAGLGIVAAVAVWAGTVGGATAAGTVGRPADWQYAECDVGQGDATVIRSGGAVALVDTGPDPALLRRCLADLGVGRIQTLVLSHFDLDHVGGTEAVLGRVDRALVGPSSGPNDDRIADGLRASGARVERATVGLTGTLGGLDWRVLWPPPRGVQPGNAASVTLAVAPAPGCAGACLTALLLGDLGAVSQTRLLGSARPPTVDVVGVAHHGSADQAPALYGRIRAPVGLIGVGAGNDYGHPTTFCLGMLADAGTRAFRTDRQGLVLVADGGDGAARVWTQRSARAAGHPGLAERADAPRGGGVLRAAFRSGGAAAWNPSSSVRRRLTAGGGDGRQGVLVAGGRARAGVDPPAQLGRDSPGPRRARVRHRGGAGGPGVARSARPPPHRGSEPRSQRSRRRRLRPG